jgi:transcriptional regulator with XRE-family HTH domain
MATPTPFLIEIGRCVASCRTAAGLSQRDVAERSNLNRSSIANIEAGRQEMPVSKLVLIADAVGVPPGKLLAPMSTAEHDTIAALAEQNRMLRERVAAAREALADAPTEETDHER